MKDTAAEVIRKSKSLIKDYDDMEAMLNKVRDEQQKKLAAENWESEVRETERLLLLGRNRAVRCVGRVVDVAEKDKGYVEDGDGDKTENGGDEAVEDDDGDADMGLLRTLEYAERGVKRMVKGIPREDEEDEDVK